MVIKSAELETVCGITSTLPHNTIPEFAFAGKSNVGKSSLINALMNRKSLARTSGQPGKTQTINYYKVNNEWYCVDLPGYGYAKVSKEIQAKWGKMIEKYLRMSKMLRLVFLLVDIRHEPGVNDVDMYNWILENGFEPVVIATKLDKINRSQIQRSVKVIRTALGAGKETRIIPFSAETKQGRDEIWALLDSFLIPDETEPTADTAAETAEENKADAADKPVSQNTADTAAETAEENAADAADKTVSQNTADSAAETAEENTADSAAVPAAEKNVRQRAGKKAKEKTGE